MLKSFKINIFFSIKSVEDKFLYYEFVFNFICKVLGV